MKKNPIVIVSVLVICSVAGMLYVFIQRDNSAQQNQVNWRDAKTLIMQCRVGGVDLGPGIYPHLMFKDGTIKTIINAPGAEEIQQVARSVSSSCGSISVGHLSVP
jgi:hypothetical protein